MQGFPIANEPLPLSNIATGGIPISSQPQPSPRAGQAATHSSDLNRSDHQSVSMEVEESEDETIDNNSSERRNRTVPI